MNRLPRWAIIVILICVLVEAGIVLGSMIWMPLARNMVMLLGGFWPPLLHGGTGVYTGQPVVMFVTYGFIHAGLMHLAMNMISLAAVAEQLARFMTARQMLAVYAVSQIAAALLFAVMAPQAGPMIGASGAVFGVAGALVGYVYVLQKSRGATLTPLMRSAGVIVVLNVALTILVPSIAWQAHLGGAAAGLIMGVAMARRRILRR